MRKYTLPIIALCSALALPFNMSAQQKFQHPSTPMRPVTDTLHGVLLTDNYRWLEDGKNQEVIDWTLAQHQATVKYINENYPAIPGLKEEITALIDRDYTGPDFMQGNRLFFNSKKKGEAQSKLYTRLSGKEKLIFDPTTKDPSGKSAMSGNDFTEDASMVAVGVQQAGAEILTYYLIDTKTGKELFKPITGIYGFNFAKDGKHAYVTIRTKEMVDKQEPPKTYWYQLGTDLNKAEFLLAPKDSKDVAGIWDARYADLTFLSEGDFYSNTLSLRKVGTKDEFRKIYSSKEFQANPEAIGNKIYFMTNDHAPNFKIMACDVNNPDFENWTTLIPEQETVIDEFAVTPENIIVRDKKDVLSRLMLYDLNGKFIKQLELPAMGSVSYVSYHRESNTLYMGIESFTEPYSIYKADPKTFKWELFYRMQTPVDTKNITASIVFYPSKDGTKIPLFLMHRKDVKLDGNNPALLYGYGGFNVGMTPSFISLAASFVNRGGVYAIACLRGGNEYGENWHRDGMLFNKQNTFDDFISAGEYLIDQKFTNPDKLIVRGGSNGGLLIGAVVTQRPDLFKGGICAVPLLDMIRYHKFLIARYWIPEYGDPDKDPDFRYLLTYSPYHNIRQGINHPTLLVTAGANDVRVDPVHAKKFVAALQNNPGQISPIMLYIDFESGHGSGKSTQQLIDDQEFQWRFMMNLAGIK